MTEMDATSADRIARVEQFIIDQRLRLAAVDVDGADPIEVALQDIEWLLRVAKLAGAAAAEARAEMRKGHAASFEADFPATAELAQIVLLEDGAR